MSLYSCHTSKNHCNPIITIAIADLLLLQCNVPTRSLACVERLMKRVVKLDNPKILLSFLAKCNPGISP